MTHPTMAELRRRATVSRSEHADFTRMVLRRYNHVASWEGPQLSAARAVALNIEQTLSSPGIPEASWSVY